MSDELVVSQCAPTLAGLKTANMFSAEYESREEVTAELRRCWKVYGDVDAARKKFESFESCTHRSRGKALNEIIQ